MHPWRLPAIVVLLLTAPAAAQDPDPQPGIEVTVAGPTVLYAHFAGAEDDFFVNTQPPTEAPDVDLHGDGPATTLDCLPDGTGQTETAHHSWYGFLVAQAIEYEDGRAQTVAERGIDVDARFDKNQDAVLYWYLSTAAPGGDAPATPQPIPDIEVIATWRAGSGIDRSTFDEGPILIQGQTTAATLVGDQVVGGGGQVQSVGRVGDRQVYEFAIPLEYQADMIQRATGASLRVDVRVDEPTCEDDGGSFMPDLVALHSSAGFRPRAALGIHNPIQLEYLHPQFVGDDLVLHISAKSPWGCSDLDLNSLQVSVEGPSPVDGLYEAPSSPPARPLFSDNCDFTFVWPGAAVNGTAGNYSVTFTIATMAGSQVVATAMFSIGEGTADSPLDPVPLLLAALLGLAALLRRR